MTRSVIAPLLASISGAFVLLAAPRAHADVQFGALGGIAIPIEAPGVSPGFGFSGLAGYEFKLGPLGITPEITTFGKYLGGGASFASVPGKVVTGRRHRKPIRTPLSRINLGAGAPEVAFAPGWSFK